MIAATHSLVSPETSGMAASRLVTLHVSFDSFALTPQSLNFYSDSFERAALTVTRHSRHVRRRCQQLFGFGCVQI
jgi:hypothetical protein